MTARRAFGTALTIALATSVFILPGAYAQEATTTTTLAPTTTTTIPAGESESPLTEGGGGAEEETDEPVIRDIVFPVAGPAVFAKSFGDCRDGCTRSHEGNDILTYGWKGVPVVAATDGRIVSTNVGGRLAGCSVVIEDDEGWRTRYLHLNVDAPGTDTEGTLCFAPGIEPGVFVQAGTLIAWVGDSGNAEETPPHLHFEIRDPEGEAVDPWLSLDAARRIRFEIVEAVDLADAAATMFATEQTAFVVPDDALMDIARTLRGETDVPLVPIDPDQPTTALSALQALQPDRIVVFAYSPSVPFLDDLRSLAPIVEVAQLVRVEDDSIQESAQPREDLSDRVAVQPPDTQADDPEIVHPINQTPTWLTVIAGRRWAVPSPATTGASPLLIIHSDLRSPRGIGAEAPTNPGPDANRDGLWWNTAAGWRVTESAQDHPPMTVAYLPEGLANKWTTAFLTSQAVAPPIPLWHYQPTSRLTKSL